MENHISWKNHLEGLVASLEKSGENLEGKFCKMLANDIVREANRRGNYYRQLSGRKRGSYVRDSIREVLPSLETGVLYSNRDIANKTGHFISSINNALIDLQDESGLVSILLCKDIFTQGSDYYWMAPIEQKRKQKIKVKLPKELPEVFIKKNYNIKELEKIWGNAVTTVKKAGYVELKGFTLDWQRENEYLFELFISINKLSIGKLPSGKVVIGYDAKYVKDFKRDHSGYRVKKNAKPAVNNL
ncbi:MAG TPA: hypothetical protein VJB94_00315 [Candidatus Nanoarchaeia archaeon]|nr:hypothetical protein [Candidatus Nanoarchaeia archaeon]